MYIVPREACMFKTRIILSLLIVMTGLSGNDLFCAKELPAVHVLCVVSLLNSH